MKLFGSSVLLAALFVAACGQPIDPMSPEDRLRAEANRSAVLEAAEKEILEAGLPPPAEAEAGASPAENGTVSSPARPVPRASR